MKKALCVLLMMLVLSGCSQEEYETMADEYTPMPPQPRADMVLALSQEVETAALESEGRQSLYFCDGYTVCQETFASGDLDATLRQITGFSREQLTLVTQNQGGIKRYDFVWTCTGEGGDQVCRGSILDDGSYHYAVTAMAGEEKAGALKDDWNQLFASFSIAPVTAGTGS